MGARAVGRANIYQPAAKAAPPSPICTGQSASTPLSPRSPVLDKHVDTTNSSRPAEMARALPPTPSPATNRPPTALSYVAAIKKGWKAINPPSSPATSQSSGASSDAEGRKVLVEKWKEMLKRYYGNSPDPISNWLRVLGEDGFWKIPDSLFEAIIGRRRKAMPLDKWSKYEKIIGPPTKEEYHQALSKELRRLWRSKFYPADTIFQRREWIDKRKKYKNKQKRKKRGPRKFHRKPTPLRKAIDSYGVELSVPAVVEEEYVSEEDSSDDEDIDIDEAESEIDEAELEAMLLADMAANDCVASEPGINTAFDRHFAKTNPARWALIQLQRHEAPSHVPRATCPFCPIEADMKKKLAIVPYEPSTQVNTSCAGDKVEEVAAVESPPVVIKEEPVALADVPYISDKVEDVAAAQSPLLAIKEQPIALVGAPCVQEHCVSEPHVSEEADQTVAIKEEFVVLINVPYIQEHCVSEADVSKEAGQTLAATINIDTEEQSTVQQEEPCAIKMEGAASESQQPIIEEEPVAQFNDQSAEEVENTEESIKSDQNVVAAIIIDMDKQPAVLQEEFCTIKIEEDSTSESQQSEIENKPTTRAEEHSTEGENSIKVDQNVAATVAISTEESPTVADASSPSEAEDCIKVGQTSAAAVDINTREHEAGLPEVPLAVDVASTSGTEDSTKADQTSVAAVDTTNMEHSAAALESPPVVNVPSVSEADHGSITAQNPDGVGEDIVAKPEVIPDVASTTKSGSSEARVRKVAKPSSYRLARLKSYGDNSSYEAARQRMKASLSQPIDTNIAPELAYMELLGLEIAHNKKRALKKRLREEELRSLASKKPRLDDGDANCSFFSIGQMDGAYDATNPPPPPSSWSRPRRILRPVGGSPTSQHGGQGFNYSGAHVLTGPNSIALPFRGRPSGLAATVPCDSVGDLHQAFGQETNQPNPRYEDGEVRRYGAGESYRPFNRDRSPRAGPRDRSPRPARSPLRDRVRSPPGGSDSYVPNRSPRRRSRSADRYRRERSREAETWRRRDRSRSRARSPIRRPSPRRSPPRRSPLRYVSPRRDDRSERARSPRRDYDARDNRRRSRSPFDRPLRNRSPLRRSPPAGPRGGSYRPRSRSPDRRDRGDDRYAPGSSYRRQSPPPRDSVINSGVTSRSASGKSSPRPSSRRGQERSRPESPAPTRPTPAPARSPIAASTPASAPPPTPVVRETPKQPVAQDITSPTLAKSPPRGPAALRAPPTGPSATRNFSTPTAQSTPNRHTQPASGPSRPDVTSPTIPPAGPRGYVPPSRGSFAPRGGRGGWSTMPPRHMPSGQSVSPTIPPTGPGGIPTGPRASGASSAAAAPGTTSASSPSLSSKPFNPPTGPAAHAHAHSAPLPRPTLAQNLLSSMPPIIPGGKIDPASVPLTTGVIRELDSHHRKLKEDEERIRDEMKMRQEKLRKSLRQWDKMERESKAFELKSDLSEKSLKNLAGEGLGGAAF